MDLNVNDYADPMNCNSREQLGLLHILTCSVQFFQDLAIKPHTHRSQGDGKFCRYFKFHAEVIIRRQQEHATNRLSISIIWLVGVNYRIFRGDVDLVCACVCAVCVHVFE